MTVWHTIALIFIEIMLSNLFVHKKTAAQARCAQAAAINNRLRLIDN